MPATMSGMMRFGSSGPTLAAIAAMVGAWVPAQVSAQVSAQDYPRRPIRIVLPYTAGSPNDVIARFVTPYLSAQLTQPLIVENRPGGGTIIGTRLAARSEPDGYTLLFSNTPTHVIAALGNFSVDYDVLQDFAPVAAVASSSLVLVIAPGLPVHSVPQLVAYAKENPGKLNFGFGQGTLPHLAGELLKAITGTEIVSIPYRGGAQAVSDLLGGRIHLSFGSASTLLPLIRAGKLRALAVTSPERSPEQPDVPTMTQAGLPEMTVVTHYGLLAPAGTPARIARKLNGRVNALLDSAEIRAAMLLVGFDPGGGSPQDFGALIDADLRKWGPIVRMTAFRIE